MSANIIRWFWNTSRGLRLQSCINAILGIIHVGLDFAFIAATKLSIDIATGRSQSSLTLAAALLIGIMLSQILMGFTRKWVAAILGVRSQNMLQLRLFDHLMQSQWSGIEKHHSGDVLNRLEIEYGLTELYTLLRITRCFLYASLAYADAESSDARS